MNHPIHHKLWNLKREKRKKAQRFELSVKRRYLKQKQGQEKVTKLKSDTQLDKRVKPERGSTFKAKKPIPFEKQRKIFHKNLNEKRENKHIKFQEIQKKQNDSLKDRFLKKRKYAQKNSRGQPRMKHMIQNLLGKIEKNLLN